LLDRSFAIYSFSMLQLTPRSTLFPYTTLFRSAGKTSPGIFSFYIFQFLIHKCFSVFLYQCFYLCLSLFKRLLCYIFRIFSVLIEEFLQHLISLFSIFFEARQLLLAVFIGQHDVSIHQNISSCYFGINTLVAHTDSFIGCTVMLP